MAIFGRVIVDIQSLTGNFFYTADLLSLYKDGWFVTERFGHTLALCKRSGNKFIHRFRLFKTDVNLDTLDLLWKPLADQQYEKYKKYLLGTTKKVIADED